jgi:two-component system OmpR family sensor kinase/two-component system sensor histidine kinase BaeS
VKRLWVQQTLAFSVVVIVTMGAIAIWINHSANAEFRKYVTLREIRTLGSGMQELVEYHQQRGSWEGVESLLAEGIYFSPDRRGILLGATSAEIGPEEKEKQPDVLLADADGQVVFDSTRRDKSRSLSRNEKANAWPIMEADDGEVIGYLLLFFRVDAPLGELEQRFLDGVEQALLVSTASAVILILVIGALLNRRLNAPLQRLAEAARAVAAGDLDQQVEAGGSTEVAQVSQAFNEMTAALNEAETLRQNMVADVAHELRTPLSVLQGNLWAILNDAYPLEKAEISRLYDETRLLSRLVDDLRELALADAGQLYLNCHSIDVAQVIRHTVDNFALAAEAQEVSLIAQLPDDPTPAQADPDRVAQVLRNLLVNALRHTPPGGSVTVSVSSMVKTLEIAIADTGEGIAPEDLPHVFERFWRADPARARSRSGGEGRLAGGTGLGLSVAQSLVKAQGGRIWAESTPEPGKSAGRPHLGRKHAGGRNGLSVHATSCGACPLNRCRDSFTFFRS